ncbi:MAG: alpha/beta hydrolase [Actinomycetota bacterium]
MDQSQGVCQLELATGVTLSYVSTGPASGTPVLLLHAWGESRRSFDRLVPVLPTIHAIAMDQRGHGDAAKPKVGYSLEHFAEDVVAFMDAAGIAKAVLVASSSGGYVAQQVAVTWPHRVAGLVLVGSPRDLRGRPPFADEVQRLSDPVDPDWVRDSLTWFPRHHQVPQWYLDDRVQDGVAIPADVWRDTFNGLVAARPPTDTGTIAAPTLLIWGDCDELLTRQTQEALASAIPNSRLLTYADTGHLVLWEQPGRVASDLIAFMDALDGGMPDEQRRHYAQPQNVRQSEP